MREIIVDGEKWKWSARKSPDWSEWTPALSECDLTLQGPDGYRRTFEVDEKIVTPSFVADFIRKLLREDRWPSDPGVIS